MRSISDDAAWCMFAAAALEGMISAAGHDYYRNTKPGAAELASKLADDLMLERAKRKHLKET